MKNELLRLGVTVGLSMTLSIEEIRALAPSVVISASGAVPVVDAIPIKGSKDVYTVNRVLRGELPRGEKVAVIGGGQSGCETAHFLAASGKRVVVVEMMGDVAVEMEGSCRKVLLQRLNDLEVEIITQSKVNTMKAEKADKVLIEGVDEKGNGARIHADDVVIALGVRSNIDILGSLQKNGPNVYVIGDSNKPATILEAIHSGNRVGREI